MDDENNLGADAAPSADGFNQFEGGASIADGVGVPVEPAPGEPGGPPAPPDYAIEARGAVDMFTACLVGYAPRTESVWSEAAKHRTAAALAPVMEKYGFSFGGLPPEWTLVIVAGPLLWQSSRLVAAQMAEEKAKKPQTVEDKTKAASVGGIESAPGPKIAPQTALYQ